MYYFLKLKLKILQKHKIMFISVKSNFFYQIIILHVKKYQIVLDNVILHE